MKEIQQYIKPVLYAIIPTIIISRFLWIGYSKTQSLVIGFIAALATTYEIFLFFKFAKGISEYVKRRDSEIDQLKENQDYIISKLQDFENHK